MAAVATAVSSISSMVNAIQLLKNVSKRFDGKKPRDEVKLQLATIKLKLSSIEDLLPQAESAVASNAILADLLHQKQVELLYHFENVLLREQKMIYPQKFDLAQKWTEILDECEKLVDDLIDFVNDKVFSSFPTDLSLDRYHPICNVPPNPSRLILDYSSHSTNEGKMKADILAPHEPLTPSIIVLGSGGTGKTCALRGLAEDLDIRRRFPDGILYIQLGSDVYMKDILRGLAGIVYQTGGIHLSEKIGTLQTLSQACSMAAAWFRQQACLFLVDDFWRMNGIDYSTITSLEQIVNGKSRMVCTSRDEYFLKFAERFIRFKPRGLDGQIARNMLLNHAGFSLNDYQSFDEETISAFKSILEECQGLPLAIGIMGGAILNWSLHYEESSKTKVWAEYWKEIEKHTTIYDDTEMSAGYESLRKVVDLSLDVLCKSDKTRDFAYLFRKLSVLQKQQSVPTNFFQMLWNLDSLEETEGILRKFSKVSLLGLTKRRGMMHVQLHDLVLDIAKHEASRHDELQDFYEFLVNRYSRKGDNIPPDNLHQPSAVEIKSNIDEVEPKEKILDIKWWDITPDGYIHENICSLLHFGNKTDELFWLLSQPQWILFRLMGGGEIQVDTDLYEGIACLGKSPSSCERTEHLEFIRKALRLSASFHYKNPSDAWFQIYGRLQWHATVNKFTKDFIKRIEDAAPRPFVKAPMGVLQQANPHFQGRVESKGNVLCVRMDKGEVCFLWNSENEIGITYWDIQKGHQQTKELDKTYFEDNRCFEDDDCFFWAALSADGLNAIVVHNSLQVCIFKTETGEMAKGYRLETSLDTRKKDTRKKDMLRRCMPSALEIAQTSEEKHHVVALSKGGNYLVTSNDKHDLQIWNVARGETIGRPLRGHKDEVLCMAINTDGTRVVTGGKDKTIRVWNALKGKSIIRPLRDHTDAVVCVAMSENCRQVVSSACDSSVLIWDIRKRKTSGIPLLLHPERVSCIRMSEDGGGIVLCSTDGTVMIRDAQERIRRYTLHGQGCEIDHVEMSKDGEFVVTVARDRVVWAWNIKRYESAVPQAVENENSHKKDAVSEGKSSGVDPENQKDEALDTESGKVAGSIMRDSMKCVWCVGMSGDYRRCVLGLSNGSVMVFDTSTGEPIGNRLRSNMYGIGCVGMNEDGKMIVTWARDKTIRIWDTESKECSGRRLASPSDLIGCVGMNGDGSRVVSGSLENSIHVWDGRSGDAIGQPLLGHSDSVRCIGLSADGKTVVSGSDDGTVRVWDVDSSKQIGGPFKHDSWVTRLGFDEKVSKIATISLNGTQKLWDVESKSCELTLKAYEKWAQVDELHLSWNGRFVMQGRKEIIGVDKNGGEMVVGTTDSEVFHISHTNVYLTCNLEPLVML